MLWVGQNAWAEKAIITDIWISVCCSSSCRSSSRTRAMKIITNWQLPHCLRNYLSQLSVSHLVMYDLFSLLDMRLHDVRSIVCRLRQLIRSDLHITHTCTICNGGIYLHKKGISNDSVKIKTRDRLTLSNKWKAPNKKSIIS